MRRQERGLSPVLLTLALVVVLGAACADRTTGAPASDRAPTSVPPTSASPSASTDDPPETDPMQIQITIGDHQYGATLDDTPATRDLTAQLPVILDMADHDGVEKTGPLPAPLSTVGEPEGADPEVGAVGYYSPGNDLVLYYGDQSYFPGIIVLGRMDGDAASRIADLDGTVTATVEAR